MSIINITVSQTGLVGVLPSVAYIETNDTIATVTTAGYLNREVANGIQFSLPCVAAVSTQTSTTASPVVAWYQLVHVAPNWSLVGPVNGSIALPSADIFVGNISGIATAVPMTGDVGISNTGLTTIQPLAVTGSKIANHTVDYGQMALEVSALISIALTSAQIIALYTTPVQILAAPGAGKFIIVDKILYDIAFVTTQYTAGGNIFGQYGNTTHGGAPAATNVLSAATFDAVAASTLITEGANPINVATTAAENVGLFLANDTAAFATGDSTMNVYVFYRVYAPA